MLLAEQASSLLFSLEHGRLLTCVRDARGSWRLFVPLRGNTALQITSSLFVTPSAVSGSVSCSCLLRAFSLPSSQIQCLKADCEVYNVSMIIQDVNKSG